MEELHFYHPYYEEPSRGLPCFFLLFPIHLGIYLLMRRLLYLLVPARPANAKLYQYLLRGPKTVAEQVDGLFICDLYVFSASYSPLQLQGPHVCQSLPEASLCSATVKCHMPPSWA